MQIAVPSIFTRKPLLILSGLSGIAILGSLILAFSKLGGLSYPLVLHFDSFQGVDFLGDTTDFWGIWLGGFACIVLNFFLGEVMFKKERILSYVFLSANLLLSLLLFVITAVIINAN